MQGVGLICDTDTYCAISLLFRGNFSPRIHPPNAPIQKLRISPHRLKRAGLSRKVGKSAVGKIWLPKNTLIPNVPNLPTDKKNMLV